MATWLAQVKDATAFLKRLYVNLKDHAQRDRAEAAGAYARERCKSIGGRTRITPGPWIGLSSEAAERIAWIHVIHGLLGLNILVAIGDSSTEGRKASALHLRLNRELGFAIRGFATAFPAEMVEGDLDALCECVVDEAADVADAAWKDVRREDEALLSVRGFLRNEWLLGIKPSLRKMLESA
jgi:hypothetical protein